MSNLFLHKTKAEIYHFVDEDWQKQNGEGVASVFMIQSKKTGGFRVVGRGEGGGWCLNTALYSAVVIQKVSDTFVQWRDDRLIYGLNFSSAQFARNFVKAFNIALHSVRNPPKVAQDNKRRSLNLRGPAAPISTGSMPNRSRGSTVNMGVPPPNSARGLASTGGASKKKGFFASMKAKRPVSVAHIGTMDWQSGGDSAPSSAESVGELSVPSPPSSAGDASVSADTDADTTDGSNTARRVSKADRVAKSDPLKARPPQPQSHRDRAAFEIFTTEQSYVAALFAICDKILPSLRSAGNVLSEDDIRKIFANVEQIRSLNFNFLVDLQGRIEEWSDQQTLGDVFLKIIPYFKVYINYYRNYDTVPAAIENFSAKKAFSRWLKTPTVGEATSGQGLLQLLIQPCQRIMRYKLLLKELFKQTPSDHPDYKTLSQAMDEVSAAAKKMNEGVREQQMSKKVADLAERTKEFWGFDKVLISGRQLIHETPVSVPLGVKTYTWMLLFNDILAFASDTQDPKSKQTVKQFELSLPLHQVWLEDIEITDSNKPKGITLQVVAPGDQLFLVNCNSKSEKEDWVKFSHQTITKCIESSDACKFSPISDSSGDSASSSSSNVTKPDASSTIRVFEYEFHTGTYAGQWVKGKPHGTGMFSYNSGNFYQGEFANGKRSGKGRLNYSAQASGRTFFEGEWENDAPHGEGKFVMGGVGTYEGGWIGGRKHGKGVMSWTNGDTYEGEWENDTMHGDGKLVLSGESTVYKGEFKNGKFHGKGCLESFWGKYEGEWKEDRKQGNGTMHYSDGSVYEGEWKDDQRSGKGVYRTKDDRIVYEGEFLDDLMHGKGKLTHKNRFVYEGDLFNGRKRGTGTLKMHSGETYQGGWADDRKEGKGVFDDGAGTIYDGQWHTDKRFGRGEETYPDGAKYVGEWVKDQKQGNGCLTFANGSQYSGNWSSDKRHGRGVFVSAKDGSKYAGEWQNDRRHGQGTLTDKSGTYDGQWEDDRRNGKGKFTCAAEKTVFEGQWVNDMRNGEGTLIKTSGQPVRCFYHMDKLDSPPIFDLPLQLPATRTIFKK
mmetsp:Transcript_1765/g.2478  ORF Transcript_1765/g.2478 Transcript_1765/m.2478 type:complete len:1057 (+) Transcript_1765:18-3188(+)